MQKIPKVPDALNKPVPDETIQTVFAKAVESHPLEITALLVFLLAFTALLGFLLCRYVITAWLINSKENIKSQERITKLNIEVKRLSQKDPKKKPGTQKR